MGTPEVSAVFDFVTAFSTLYLAHIALNQLTGIKETQQKTEENDRKWRTLQVCDRYDIDPVLREVRKKLNEYLLRREKKQKISDTDAKEYEDCLFNLFNYFDSIAIGISQELYLDKIVKAHLDRIVWQWFEDFEKDSIFEKEAFPAIVERIRLWGRPSY